jgi:hypothetical protein
MRHGSREDGGCLKIFAYLVGKAVENKKRTSHGPDQDLFDEHKNAKSVVSRSGGSGPVVERQR